MKAAATILLAAALGSTSPVGMQARDGQCDCSKTFYASTKYWDYKCPAGYENISKVSIAGITCAQPDCSVGEYERRCGVRP
ncbi:hypothetical protein ISF_06176 [Cordyceps fumosorosea ARSEF 2679]|uniref:Uncharacterized protein n=1 Tax=Cordyceps fumosorosea (strain ARSEF 2679) TaxID=1081104 RepID=A0A167T210_CORFA|nr:hypothetical protein ISF_06176 [Cordyceps fumosorosea ARSEF 2679]OAA60166.1 hypothetical protein ISF_06176 [Cordyceps fumosorosea ARSEF 2679]